MKNFRFLSILVSLIAIFAFTSCAKEDIVAPTTYTVKADVSCIRELANEYNATCSVELRFYEYNDNNELIEYKIWESPSGEKKFIASDLASKVVVFLDAEVTKGSQTMDYHSYDAKIHYLKKEGNITIVNNGQTLGQKYNPID